MGLTFTHHTSLLTYYYYYYWFTGFLIMYDLTLKQISFARLVIELGNKAKAYRLSYNTKGSDSACSVAAQKLMKIPAIASYIDELRSDAADLHGITVHTLLDELELARIKAMDQDVPQTSAAIAAIMGKAKLCGLDKQTLHISNPDGSLLAPTRIELVAGTAVVDAINSKHW
jgi:phage terminase small subunit